MEENQSNFDEKLEFLKREEIRTMAKDVAKLREEEAQKERERIAAMAPKNEAPKAQEIKETAPPTNLPITPEEKPVFQTQPKEEKPTVPTQPTVPIQSINIIPPPLKKSFSVKKILIRVGVVLMLVSLIGFFCWLFIVNQQDKEKKTPIEEGPIIQEQINIPSSLITVKEDKNYEVSDMETVPDIFKQLLKEDLEQGTFTRILIKDLAKNQMVSLRDIAFAFQLTIPEEIYPKLEDNVTFSVFSQKQGNRLAFVEKVKETEGLLEILKNWEKEIEENGIFLSGQEISALVPYFQQGSYKEVTYRYLTISKQDFGICYSIFDDYLIFTSSWESLAKTIDLLLKIKEGKVEEITPSTGEIPSEEEVTPPIEEIPPEEVPPEEIIQIPLIQERILDWGYSIPVTSRTIDTIILHSAYNAIGGDVYDVDKVIEEYQMYGVTSHYLIARNGIIYRLAPEEAIAYHAGVSQMPDGSRVNIINNFSIGIEIIHTNNEFPNEEQYQSLIKLVKYLKQKYNIPFENIFGHNQIAPERKTDPWNFNWKYFRTFLEK